MGSNNNIISFVNVWKRTWPRMNDWKLFISSSGSFGNKWSRVLVWQEQEVDHAKRAAQDPRFQAKRAELDDQVRMLQRRDGCMDREAKGKLERMERDARQSQQRRGEWPKGLKKVMEGIKGQFEKFDDAMVGI